MRESIAEDTELQKQFLMGTYSSQTEDEKIGSTMKIPSQMLDNMEPVKIELN